MKLTALICTRNSDWVIGLSLRAALMYCDEAVVLLHNCTDRTADIVAEISAETGRVITLALNSGSWDEMEHRQQMLDCARHYGATHLMLIDDDEVLTGNLLPTIRYDVGRTPVGTILQLPWLCLRYGVGNVITTGLWGYSSVSVAFQDAPYWHWKSQGQEAYEHHHRHPMGRQFVPHYGPVPMRSGGLMHLQFASRRRLLAKQAWYQAIERLRWPSRPMPDYVRTVREAELAHDVTVPESWWAPYQHLMPHLHLDAEPWQEAELRRLIAEHGRERFVGLDFFGVA